MGELSKGSGISSIRGGDFELGASGVTAVASSDLVVEDITPLALMPLEDSLELVLGSGTATFTRSTIKTFDDRNDGLVKTAAIDVAAFEQNGFLAEGSSTNEALHSRDFTNAVHVKTNITAAKDAIGADGVANAASTLTATAANGTVFQTITKASAENTYSIDVRRKTGSGVIEISDDGGTGFTDITASINSTTYTRFQITTTQANPSIGFRIVTSGDEIEVDYEGLEALPFATSRIEVTTTPVTRAEDNLIIDPANISQSVYSLSMDFTPAANGDDYAADVDLRLWGTDDSRGTNTEFRTVAGVAYSFTDQVGGGFYTLLDTDFVKDQLTKWVFIAEQNGANADIDVYRDAVNKLSVSPVLTLDHSNTSIGIGHWPTREVTFGHVKNFRIYDVALTAAQVAAL